MHMKQLCYPPTPICPSTDSILQLDIIPPHRQGEEEKEEKKKKRRRRGGIEANKTDWGGRGGGGQHSFQLSQRLRRRK